jgi:hypothetical protein
MSPFDSHSPCACPRRAGRGNWCWFHRSIGGCLEIEFVAAQRKFNRGLESFVKSDHSIVYQHKYSIIVTREYMYVGTLKRERYGKDAPMDVCSGETCDSSSRTTQSHVLPKRNTIQRYYYILCLDNQPKWNEFSVPKSIRGYPYSYSGSSETKSIDHSTQNCSYNLDMPSQKVAAACLSWKRNLRAKTSSPLTASALVQSLIWSNILISTLIRVHCLETAY